MTVKSRVFAVFFSLIAACAPQGAVSESGVAAKPEKTEQANAPQTDSPAVVGDYLRYLQARREQNLSDAAKYLQKVLDKDADNEIVEAEMLSTLTLQGRLHDAFPLAQKELKRDGKLLLAMLVVVANQTENKDYDGALKTLDAFPDQDVRAFLIPLLKSWQYVGLNEREKAQNALEPLDSEGTAALYHFHLALMNDIWNNEDETEKHYKLLMEKNKGLSLRAAQTYGNFLLRHEKYERFNELLAAYRTVNRSFPLIDETFFLAGGKEVGKNIPVIVPSAKEGMAEALFDVAGSLHEKGNEDSAFFFTQIALSLDEKLALARELKGTLLETTGRLDDARAFYESEKTTSETYFSSQSKLARLLARQEKYDEAVAVLQNLIKKKSESHLPYLDLGDTYMLAKRYPQAIEAYTQALDKISGTQRRGGWMIYYSRGTAYERNNQWDKAEDDFLHALLLNPDQPLTLNYLGYSWLERGKNVEQAKEMLERALLKASQSGSIADSLGWAYYLTKEYDKAVTILEIAVALDAGSGVINDHLGDAYWRSGRKREARFQWRKALDLNDDFAAGDRDRVRLKLDKGLDEVGDKISLTQEKKDNAPADAAAAKKPVKKNDSKKRARKN